MLKSLGCVDLRKSSSSSSSQSSKKPESWNNWALQMGILFMVMVMWNTEPGSFASSRLFLFGLQDGFVMLSVDGTPE